MRRPALLLPLLLLPGLAAALDVSSATVDLTVTEGVVTRLRNRLTGETLAAPARPELHGLWLKEGPGRITFHGTGTTETADGALHRYDAAELATGSQPLVPPLDYVLFAHPNRGRVLQNIGGIANLTAIPAASAPDQVIAFDTGPGNMVIDALAQQLFGKSYDRNGALAAEGTVLATVLAAALRNPYYRLKPPRTAGREQFGREFAAKFLAACNRVSRKPEDALATATALTAETITRSYRRFVQPKMKGREVDCIISGGGARNHTLMAMLTQRLEPLGCELTTSVDFGLPVEAKEAAAFALLAWQTWHRLPGNLLAATGANRPAILGQVTYA